MREIEEVNTECAHMTLLSFSHVVTVLNLDSKSPPSQSFTQKVCWNQILSYCTATDSSWKTTSRNENGWVITHHVNQFKNWTEATNRI